MDWRQDKDYLDYIDSGESAAVYIVKNIVKSLDTKNMWVDVVSKEALGILRLTGSLWSCFRGK